MKSAPAPVSQKALRMAGMRAGDIDLWEINEAFATVPLQTMRKLGIDHAKVNVNGGAIALGHPLGATGAILALTAIDELERSGKSTALITMCIGGARGTEGDRPVASQTRSRIVAMPIPPPMQSVTRAVDLLVRSSSSIAVPMRQAPVAPRGWPSAIAPPFTFTLA